MRLSRLWNGRIGLRSALTAAALAGLPAIALAQQSITGRVTAQESGQPLGDARVYLVGTTLVTVTNADGRYTLRTTQSGALEVRVIRVGYTQMKKPVTVATGGSATVDFVMDQAAVQLSEIVTTATGEQRK